MGWALADFPARDDSGRAAVTAVLVLAAVVRIDGAFEAAGIAVMFVLSHPKARLGRLRARVAGDGGSLGER